MTMTARSIDKLVISAKNDAVAAIANQSATAQQTMDTDTTYEAGTGAGQVDRAYIQNVGVINGLSIFDLQGDTTDIGAGPGNQLDGESKSISTIYEMRIENKDAGAAAVTVRPSTTNGFNQFFSAVVIQPGGEVVFKNPNGLAVTASDKDIEFEGTQVQNVRMSIVGKST